MFDTLSPDDLLTEVEQCRREESAIIFRRLTAVAALLERRTAETAELDDDPGYCLVTGFARTSAEVGAALNMPPSTASIMVGHAEALDSRLPEIGALLADGRIDWPTCEAIIRRTDFVEPELMPALDQALATRVSTWQSWSRRRVLHTVDAAVARIDPDAAKKRRQGADTDRHVTVTAHPNGMATIRATVTAPAAAIFEARVAAMAASVCARDPRSTAQRRADAITALSLGRELECGCGRSECPVPIDASAGGGSVRVVINVIASADTLSGASEEPGHLQGYGVIDADQVRDLADLTTNTGTGSVVFRPVAPPTATDVAASLRYQPSAAVARWIRCRDLTCRFPGCDRPAWRADVDHTVPFDHANPRRGGRTVAANLDCYCRQHHLVKTFLGGPGGWTDRQLGDGTMVFTSPTGRVYRTTPDGAELFDGIAAACRPPVPRPRNRAREKAARIAAARHGMHAKHAANEATLALNRARRHEIDIRKWRNDMRRKLLVFKGGAPSTSPFCTWVNDPYEDDTITADWRPPQPNPPQADTTPPF